MSTITGPSQRVQSRVSHTGFVVIMLASMVVRIDKFHTANFSVRHQGNPVRPSTLRCAQQRFVERALRRKKLFLALSMTHEVLREADARLLA